MFEFIFKIMDHRIKQIYKSETTKEKETNTSKNADAFIVSEKYLEVLISSLEVKFLYKKCKVPKMTKEMISEIEVKVNNLFENFVTTSTEIGFDDIVALAVAYFNLGNIYTHKEVNLKAAEDHLMKYIELLKGKELHSKVILTAIQARVDLNIVYIKLQQLEKCYPLLDEALELYVNYTKNEDEYPDPFDIGALYHSKEIINSKIRLTTWHIVTLKHMIQLYYIQPRNMHKFVIYVHNLLIKQLKSIENSTENDMFIYWAKASTDLSIYFLYYDGFIEAKIHLAAAEYMTLMYYVLIITDQDANSPANNNKYNLVYTFIIHLWAVYRIMLLRSSKERLLQFEGNRFCEANNIESKSHSKSEEELMKLLTFVDLEKDLENIGNYHITDTYMSNLKDVKIIFANVLRWLNVVYMRFKVINKFIPQVQIILRISKAYKYYAYFEGSKSKQIKVIKQQTKMLENYISALSSKYSTLQEYQYYKHLYFELAITYSTLLNMTSELNEIEKITGEMEMETKRLVGNIIHNFYVYLYF